MSGRSIIGILIAVVIIVGVVFMWKRSTIGQPMSSSSLVVAATIFPLADIAQQIGGELVDVVLLIPPGVTEHSSAFTPQKLQDLQNAQVIFAIGQGLEDALVQRVQTALTIPVVTVDAGITLREFAEEHHDEGEEEETDEHHEAGSHDPHYWLIVPNAKIIATTIAQELQQRDPVHASEYEQRLATYLQTLDSVEGELQTQAAQLTQRNFIAMHNAWSYFAAQYGLNLVGTYEPREGQQPSLADLQEFKALVDRYGLHTFYAEPQKTTTAATRFLAEEFGLTILTLDPVGGLEGTKSYVDLMRYNMAAIVEGQ